MISFGKKSKSKAKPRATVGSNKKKIAKKKLVLLVVPVVALLGLGGYFGVKQLQLRQLKARAAAGWTEIDNWLGNSPVLACKIPVKTEFGPLWKIKLLLINGTKEPKEPVNVSFNINLGEKLVASMKMYARPGQWVYKEAYAPMSGHNYFVIIGGINRGGASEPSSFDTITNKC